jgi:methyl-accepting chemotaxis protein
MSWFYNLKIAAKLLISFFIVALISGVVGFVGIININNIQALDEDMYNRNTDILDDLARILQSYQQERSNLRDMVILKEDSERQKRINANQELDKIIDESMAVFEKSIKDEKVLENFNNMEKALVDFKQHKEMLVNLIMTNQESQAVKSIYGDGIAIANNVQSSAENLLNLKTSLAQQSADSNKNTAKSAVVTMIAIIIGSMIAAAALGIFVSLIISRPVRKMVEAADKLSVGDINVNVEATTKDEIGTLMKSFSKMVENIREQALVAEKIAAGDLTVQVRVKSDNDLLGKKLSEMIQMNNEILNNINSASEQVAAGARQVSASGQILSQGSTEQASSIEEITSSMTQVAAQTKQNATNANQANELATSAKENAIQGNSQMQEMVKAMAEINDSSANISKIIKVIDEIAFQTNILALNAAVEAARAGQHGKGFAVVAEEVRNLAARSANAAKETTDMIEGSINKVEAGTRIANETAGALNKIVEGVAKAAALVGDIASASNEQATGISQVNQAIAQVAQVVQTNSATAEESASASEELSSQAQLLKEEVSKFRLKNVKSLSSGNFDSLSPDIIRMIEDTVEKKKTSHKETSIAAVADTPANSKSYISLEDKNFGKY